MKIRIFASYVKQDQDTTGDGALITVTDYDPLGRVRLTRQLENSSQRADDDTAGIKSADAGRLKGARGASGGYSVEQRTGGRLLKRRCEDDGHGNPDRDLVAVVNVEASLFIGECGTSK
jgi:hypothetical protein